MNHFYVPFEHSYGKQHLICKSRFVESPSFFRPYYHEHKRRDKLGGLNKYTQGFFAFLFAFNDSVLFLVALTHLLKELI